MALWIGLTATNITLCLTNIWQVFRKCFYQQRALLIISRLLQKRKARYLHDTFFQCALHDASEDCIHLSEYGVATIYYIVMWCERPKCSQLTLNSDEDGGQKRERKKVVLQSNDRSPKPIWFLDHVIQETFSFFGEKKKIRVWWCSKYLVVRVYYTHGVVDGCRSPSSPPLDRKWRIQKA